MFIKNKITFIEKLSTSKAKSFISKNINLIYILWIYLIGIYKHYLLKKIKNLFQKGF